MVVMETYDTMSTNMAMANAGKLISVNDWVKCEGRVCYVQNILNNLGFNQYFVVDIDSGVVLKRSCYQLEPTEVQAATIPLPESAFANDTIVQVKHEDHETPKVNLKLEKRRFLDVSADQLDSIKLNRTSIRTRKQTAWAVSMLKSEFTATPPPQGM